MYREAMSLAPARLAETQAPVQRRQAQRTLQSASRPDVNQNNAAVAAARMAGTSRRGFFSSVIAGASLLAANPLSAFAQIVQSENVLSETSPNLAIFGDARNFRMIKTNTFWATASPLPTDLSKAEGIKFVFPPVDSEGKQTKGIKFAALLSSRRGPVSAKGWARINKDLPPEIFTIPDSGFVEIPMSYFGLESEELKHAISITASSSSEVIYGSEHMSLNQSVDQRAKFSHIEIMGMTLARKTGS